MPITKATVARQAGVSVVFLRRHPDLVQAIADAQTRPAPLLATGSSRETAKDQVIAALRRRLEEMKRELTEKDTLLRQKQREIDRLYGKLAAASPLTDADLRQKLQDALHRLATLES